MPDKFESELQLEPQEQAYITYILGDYILPDTVLEFILVHSQEELLELPQKLRAISYENTFLLNTKQVIQLCIFAKAYLLKQQGFPVLMKVVINPKVREKIDSAQFTEASIRRDLEISQVIKSLPHLEGLGLLEDELDIQELSDRLGILDRLIVAEYARLPERIDKKLRFDPRPQESFSDRYYLLSLAATKYYREMLGYLASRLEETEGIDRSGFLLGLQSYLTLKLANQPYREVYCRLESLLTEESEVNTAEEALIYLSKIYDPGSEGDMYRGAVYCLGYSQLLRSRVEGSVASGLGELGPEESKFINQLWSLLASINNSRPFSVLSQDSQLPDVKEIMFQLFEIMGKMQKPRQPKQTIPDLVFAAGKLFEKLIAYLERNEALGAVLPPTQLIYLPQLLDLWEKAKSSLLEIDSELEEEGEDESVSLDLRRNPIEVLIEKSARMRILKANLVPANLDIEMYPARTVLEVRNGNLREARMDIKSLRSLYNRRVGDLQQFIQKQAYRIERYKATTNIDGNTIDMLSNRQTGSGIAEGIAYEPTGIDRFFGRIMTSQLKWLKLLEGKSLIEQPGILKLGGHYNAEVTHTDFSRRTEFFDVDIQVGQLRHDMAVVMVPENWILDTASYSKPVVEIELIPYMVVVPTTIITSTYETYRWGINIIGYLGEGMSKAEMDRTSVGVHPGHNKEDNHILIRIVPFLPSYDFREGSDPILLDEA